MTASVIALSYFVTSHFHTCLCGSSSVGRATAFQAVGRGFEPRLPLLPAGALAQAGLHCRVSGVKIF